jgi:hypothetical protein
VLLVPLVGDKKTSSIVVLFSCFLLLGSVPSIVFASSENWVEVDRFTGGSWNGGTRPFIINHIEWRIRWNYEPIIDVDSMGFHFMVMDVDHNYIDIVFGDEKRNGTLYLNQDGEFYLDISGLHVEYTIIVEENIESITEFPSMTILLLLLMVIFATVIYKKKLTSELT